MAPTREGRRFLILYACAHEVSFPDRRPRSLVWKREYTSERAGMVGTVCRPLLSCIISTLFAYFLACHPYIFLHFLMFKSCIIMDVYCFLWHFIITLILLSYLGVKDTSKKNFQITTSACRDGTIVFFFAHRGLY